MSDNYKTNGQIATLKRLLSDVGFCPEKLG